MPMLSQMRSGNADAISQTTGRHALPVLERRHEFVDAYKLVQEVKENLSEFTKIFLSQAMIPLKQMNPMVISYKYST